MTLQVTYCLMTAAIGGRGVKAQCQENQWVKDEKSTIAE
jgi:hypothetical protein